MVSALVAATCPKWLSLTAAPGTSNLRLYLHEATLPPLEYGSNLATLPVPDGKSHANHLNVRDEMWRRLKIMDRLVPEVFKQDTRDFVRTLIPCTNVGEDWDPVLGEMLTVPCPPLFLVRHKAICYALDVEKVSRWVKDYPLDTVQRVLHAAFPETRCWSFHLNDLSVEPDSSLARFFTWDLSEDAYLRHASPLAPVTSVAVMVQCPWIATKKELQAFLPRGRDKDERARYRSQERIWAKLWDFCARRKCHYFVITNYSEWVFGAFTPGRTRGFVSPIIMCNDKDTGPTVLETLTFWVASAMHLPKGNYLPPVLESVQDILSDTTFDIPPAPSVRLPSPQPSETDWSEDSDFADGMDQDQEDAEEVANMLYVPMDGLEQLPILPPQPRSQQTVVDRIMAWHDGLDDDAMSEAPSEAITVSSAATTVRGAMEDREEDITNGRNIVFTRSPLGILSSHG